VTMRWKTFAGNPVVSGVTGAAFAGLIGWILRMLLKPAPVPGAPAPVRKTRRLRRRSAT
jgi:hypothetical protein